ncbi:hypothetical protein TRFO_22673 [Tritrichomonas foetus]|uniref:Uncharacterized protein n=1 Tax=Tritrichomonas foetus TaxID=1144522 RepID=A0A1J4KC08_9EUKA|nr:hypothetical protein TRFO_22673 [Tritrichomonas foetus]|eukprot:OHT08755.1 hypothetical protein TRFO_22673 [Tritrichomonas foetus]
MKKENKIIELQPILVLLKSLLNVNDPTIQGKLFESYGHLELQKPCVFTYYNVTNSRTTRSFEYSKKGYLYINFCSHIKLINKPEYDFEHFVTQLQTTELYTNYVFKPPNPSQPLYDALLYDNHDKYLYIIQMTVSPKHNFEEREFLKIFRQLTK